MINYVIPIYTAGGCHMYYGQLENGVWFFTSDSWDYCYTMTEDPSPIMWEDDFENMIQNKVIDCIEGTDFDEFYRLMLNWLVDNGYTIFINY